MSNENNYPTIEEIDSLHTNQDLATLGAEIKCDLAAIGQGDTEERARQFPAIAAKYAVMLAECDLEESLADTKMKIVRSRIILAFEDNPRAFLSNTRRRNVQICEAVYRTHPQFRSALKELLLVTAKRKMLTQASYAIDQTRTMLSILSGAKANCAPSGTVLVRDGNAQYTGNQG